MLAQKKIPPEDIVGAADVSIASGPSILNGKRKEHHVREGTLWRILKSLPE